MKKQTRKIQIGVIGSCIDLNYSQKTANAAFELGTYITMSGNTMLFGAERDLYSLSQAACKGAKKAKGLTVGITYGKGFDIVEDADVIIPTGVERGGGRECVLAISSEVLICISGGSGTLNEIVAAYQANIPLVALTGYGGWADKLADTYIDDRKRVKVVKALTPQEAVTIAIQLAIKEREKVI